MHGNAGGYVYRIQLVARKRIQAGLTQRLAGSVVLIEQDSSNLDTRLDRVLAFRQAPVIQRRIRRRRRHGLSILPKRTEPGDGKRFAQAGNIEQVAVGYRLGLDPVEGELRLIEHDRGKNMQHLHRAAHWIRRYLRYVQQIAAG